MEESNLLNAILEKTHEAIIAVDADNRIIKCNRKMLGILNETPSRVLGADLEKALPGIDAEKEISNYDLGPHKKSFIVRAEKLPLDESGHKVFFFSDNHFNIELANRYAETKVLNDVYESILNSIDEGIHVADINGNIKYINPSQRNLDGLSDDVIGKHWTEVYDLDDETSFVLKALKEARYTYDEYQNYVTRGGKYVSIVCSAMPLYSEGRIIGAVAITKDFLKFKEMAERILSLDREIHKTENKKKRKHKEKYFTFTQIMGNNKQIRESIKWGKAGAKSNSSVLIYGDTGTGKEMFAQSIHSASERSGGPFVAINCSAIPENLLEGILFGTTKGAFTGSVDRIGLIELASGGTLFLDEINSMPFQLQSKLLRVLEEKKIMRLGGKENTPVDIRVLASCNQEPSAAIEQGQLRRDLFYRLAVIYIYLPPLRERLDDLDILTGYFIENYNREMGKQVKGVSPDVKILFELYSWPGNVRELMHCLECAVSLAHAEETLITPEHLPRYLLIGMQNEAVKTSAWPQSGTLLGKGEEPEVREEQFAKSRGNIIEQIRQQEMDEITTALKLAKGNISQAAASLGLSRQRLHYRLKKYELI